MATGQSNALASQDPRIVNIGTNKDQTPTYGGTSQYGNRDLFADVERQKAEDKARADAGTAARGAALAKSNSSSSSSSSKPSSSPAPAPAAPPASGGGIGGGSATGGIGAGGPVGGVPPAVQKAALTGLSAGDQQSTSIGSGVGQGQPNVQNVFQGGGSPNLRQNLGNRIYPQESYALAALRQAY